MEVQNTVRLHGMRVNLCTLRADEDAIRLYAKWINNEKYNHWLGHGDQEMTLLAEKEFIEKRSKPEAGAHYFNIVAGETLIGTCNVSAKNRTSGWYVLGIMIGDESYQGQDYGKEVVDMLCRYAFQNLNARTITLNVCAGNERAIGCYVKCGFQECGRISDAVYYEGKYDDMIMMQLTWATWESMN